jgi:hypothetical protein
MNGADAPRQAIVRDLRQTMRLGFCKHSVCSNHAYGGVAPSLWLGNTVAIELGFNNV